MSDLGGFGKGRRVRSLGPPGRSVHRNTVDLSADLFYIGNMNLSVENQGPVQFFSRRVREKLGSHLSKIMLFGSRARGDYREGSDFDFLVVLDQRTPDLEDMISEIEVEFLDRYDTLSPCVAYDLPEWERAKYFPLGLNIQKEGILL